jgi:hypothetical protein
MKSSIRQDAKKVTKQEDLLNDAELHGDSLNISMGAAGMDTTRQSGNMGQEATSMQSAARSGSGDQNATEMTGGVGGGMGSRTGDLDHGTARDQEQVLNADRTTRRAGTNSSGKDR